MGMYTAFHIGLEIKRDVPLNVVQTLNRMVHGGASPYTPDHPLFDCERWDVLLSMDSYHSAYQQNASFVYDDCAKCYYLSATSSLKNYNDEIDKFLDWITPYVGNEDEFVGYKRYEQDDHPTLIYWQDGEFKLRSPRQLILPMP